jgi:transposase-like protein
MPYAPKSMRSRGCSHFIEEIFYGILRRCRTHYAANLMAATPKASWPWGKTLLHSVYDQPDAASGGHGFMLA